MYVILVVVRMLDYGKVRIETGKGVSGVCVIVHKKENGNDLSSAETWIDELYLR